MLSSLVVLLTLLGQRTLYRPCCVYGQSSDVSTDTLGDDAAIDVSWDFSENDLVVGYHVASMGWGNALAQYQMNIVITIRNGQFSGLIVGDRPNFASPLMQIMSTPRHYMVMRMNYVGPNRDAEVLIRTGPLTQSSETFTSYPESQWQADQQPVCIYVSSNSTAAGAKAVDDNLYTYYLSDDQPSGVELMFDLGDFRWITAVRIVPLGGEQSPKTVLLQMSLSIQGNGPFVTVATTVLQPTSDLSDITEQTITGFSEHARIWKILILDNYGATDIGIRDLKFDGYTDNVQMIPYTLNNSGLSTMYYIPIGQKVLGPILRMRLDFFREGVDQPSADSGRPTHFDIDYIRIARAPEIHRVLGCVDVYYNTSSLEYPAVSVHPVLNSINRHLPLWYFEKVRLESAVAQYATTFGCPLSGGVNISVEGVNFGSNPRVFVAGVECYVYELVLTATADQLDEAHCLLPGSTTHRAAGAVPPGTLAPGLGASVRVQNGAHPGLFYEYPGLTYRSAPGVIYPPTVTNIAAHKVDLVWSPHPDYVVAMSTTGYKILWFQPKYSSRVSNMTVGNVTTTSVRGLSPGTEYVFAIAALSEGAFPEAAANQPTDLYGRREQVRTAGGSFVGSFSVYTNVTATLGADIDYIFFSANATVNSSAAVGDGRAAQSVGPSGQFGSEGNYGLVLVGAANVQNCNQSATCCDGYNATQGISSCRADAMVCAVVLDRMFDGARVVDGAVQNQIPTSLSFPDGGHPSINMMRYGDLLQYSNVQVGEG